jgi:hypothetical protein
MGWEVYNQALFGVLFCWLHFYRLYITMIIHAPISIGELIDKITILELKLEFLFEPKKLENVNTELKHLNIVLNTLTIPDITAERDALKLVNRRLWHIENFKRECEKNQTFGEEFVETARQVYLKNDLRAEIKRKINLMVGSTIVEEKSY